MPKTQYASQRHHALVEWRTAAGAGDTGYVDPTATQREGSGLPQLNYGRNRVVQDAGAIDVSMPRRRRMLMLLALRQPR